MSSEFTTLALLTYSLALVGIFAFPSVRQRVPRVAVALLVIVPWAAALFAGALTHDTYDVPPVLAIELHDPPRLDDPIIFDENGTQYVRADRYDALSDNEKYMAKQLPVFDDASRRRMLFETGMKSASYELPSCIVDDDGSLTKLQIREGKCRLYVTPNLKRSSPDITRELLRRIYKNWKCPDHQSTPELTIHDEIYDILTCPE